MSDYKHIIPFIFRHENYISDKDLALPFEQLFAKARSQGVFILPDDKGGPTLCGITMSTYNEYNKKAGKPLVDLNSFTQMDADDWMGVFKSMFWSKIGGDGIQNQAIADMMVDWAWTSGYVGVVKRVQKIVGAKRDGIVGPKTLALINSRNSVCLLDALVLERCEFYRERVRKNPKQRKFLQGWINRTKDCAKWK